MATIRKSEVSKAAHDLHAKGWNPLNPIKRSKAGRVLREAQGTVSHSRSTRSRSRSKSRSPSRTGMKGRTRTSRARAGKVTAMRRRSTRSRTKR